jgi:hypothetical protein
MYSATFEEVSTPTPMPRDFFQIEVTSVNHAILIHSMSITQSSDVDDEELEISYRVDLSFGIGGTEVTAAPLQVGDPAFSGHVYTNASKGTGTAAELGMSQFNILQGFHKVFSPNERLLVPTYDGVKTYVFLLTLPNSVADDLTFSGTIVFEEI